MGADQEARFAIELDVQGVQQSEGLADALTRLQAQIKADQAAVNELQAAMRRLQQGGSVNIDTFKQLKNQLAAKKASLASAQESYVKLGGTFGQVAKEAKVTGGGFDELLASAQSAGGPLGQLAGVAGRLKGMLGNAGAAGAALVLVAALAAVVVGAFAAIAALAKFALVSADAARSQRLFLEAAAGGRVAADALSSTIDAVAGRVATARGQIEELAVSLGRSGLEGRALDAALSAIATTSAVMGQAAGSALQGIAERARMARRFVLGAFDLNGTGLKLADVAGALAQRLNVSFAAAQAAIQSGTVKVEDGLEALDAAVQAKFGKIAKAQLLAFNTQIQKAHENVARIFAGVNVEKFLEALHDVLSVLDQSTVTGRALRALAETVLNPLFDKLSALGPIAKAFFQGLVIGTLLVVIGVLKIRKAFQDAFGGSTKSSIDWMKVALYAGIGLVGALTTAVLLLTVAMLALATATAPLWLPFLLAIGLVVAAVIYLMGLFSDIGEALGSIDLENEARNLVNGLVNGIKAAGVAAIFEMMKLAEGLKTAFKSALGIHSPSKVFAEFGGYTAEGFAQGVEGGAGRVEDAVGSMVSTPSRPSNSGAATGGAKGSGNTYQIINHFYGRDADDDLVAKIRQVVLEVFEGTAIEMAAPLGPEAG